MIYIWSGIIISSLVNDICLVWYRDTLSGTRINGLIEGYFWFGIRISGLVQGFIWFDVRISGLILGCLV